MELKILRKSQQTGEMQVFSSNSVSGPVARRPKGWLAKGRKFESQTTSDRVKSVSMLAFRLLRSSHPRPLHRLSFTNPTILNRKMASTTTPDFVCSSQSSSRSALSNPWRLFQNKILYKSLAESDPDVQNIIDKETWRQFSGLELIASEVRPSNVLASCLSSIELDIASCDGS